MKLMIAVSDQGTKRIIMHLLDSLKGVEIMQPASTTRETVTKELYNDIFDFIIMDYNSDKVNGREICKQIYDQSRCLETYIIMLVSDMSSNNARADLKTYLSTSEIGKTIELLEQSDLSSLLVKIVDLSSPQNRRSLAISGVYMTPYDSRTVLFFLTAGLCKLQDMNGSLKTYDALRRDTRIMRLIEQLIEDYGGSINVESFATGTPIQAIFEKFEEATLAWNELRSHLALTACAIAEGPIKRIRSSSGRSILYGHVFEQASKLLEIATQSDSTLVVTRSHLTPDSFSGICNVKPREDILVETFDGYEIYELLWRRNI